MAESDYHVETHHWVRRVMTILPLALLVVSVSVYLIGGSGLAGSISASYCGPDRDFFVGVLIATGVCLVAYQGRTALEDYLLSGAGFYAVLVALVPYHLHRAAADRACDISSETYGIYLRAALMSVVLLYALLMYRQRGNLRVGMVKPEGVVLVVVTQAALWIFVGFMMYRLWWPNGFEWPTGASSGIDMHGIGQLSVHFMAAILLILSLAAVVFVHAFPVFMKNRVDRRLTVADSDKDFIRIYRVILFLMTIGLIVPVVASYLPPFRESLILLIEWWEILLFVFFWHTESKRERASHSEGDRPSAAAETP